MMGNPPSNGRDPRRAAESESPPERRVPTSAPNVRLRNGYTLTSQTGSGGREHHAVTAPKRGPDRQRAKRAIMTVLRRAERQQHRVSFLLTFSNYTQLPMFELGYDPGLALTHCQAKRDDPYAWLLERSRSGGVDDGGSIIIGVAITTWPREGMA